LYHVIPRRFLTDQPSLVSWDCFIFLAKHMKTINGSRKTFRLSAIYISPRIRRIFLLQKFKKFCGRDYCYQFKIHRFYHHSN
jgi:hypothetical protein